MCSGSAHMRVTSLSHSLVALHVPRVVGLVEWQEDAGAV